MVKKIDINGFGAIGAILIIILLAVAGFGGYKVYTIQTQDKSDSTSEQQKSSSNNSKEVTTKATIIKTGDSEFGPMLFDEKGQAIYIWELEESATAECYDDCADEWPPVLTEKAPQASGSVNPDLLGTTKRNDGTTQVTYNDHPLYYYADEGVGEVKCHNVSTHGGLWWVIQPSGDRAV